MSVTLKQIAEQVQVNVATVSRVLHNPAKARASEQTKRRIREAAKALGYRPHAAAQALAGGRTGFVGVLVPDLLDPFNAQCLDVITCRLSEADLQAIPFATGRSAEGQRRCIEAMQRHLIDSAICFRYEPANADLYEQVQAAGHTLAFLVSRDSVQRIAANAVGVDEAEAFELLLRHLAEQGYQRIAVVGGGDLQAWRDGAAPADIRHAFERSTLQLNPAWMIPCDNHAGATCSQVVAAWQSRKRSRFDAIIVRSSGPILHGVRQAARELDLKAPDELGLAALWDCDTCEFSEVPITACAAPLDKAGDALVRIVSEQAGPIRQLHKLQFNARLVCRASTLRHVSA